MRAMRVYSRLDKRPAKSRSLSLAKFAARVGAASAAVSHLRHRAAD